MSAPLYPSDLTDAEWQRIEPMLPPEKRLGKHRKVDRRYVLDAIFYRADNGIKWRALPVDFPPWQTVYGYFHLWVKLGVWEQINTLLVEHVRTEAGRNAQPSLAMIDSQLVKMAVKGGGTWFRRQQEGQMAQAPYRCRCDGVNAGMFCQCGECGR